VDTNEPVVLVAGAAGGIGSATCRAFLERRALVVGIDKASAPRGLQKHPGYRHFAHEIEDGHKLQSLLLENGISSLDHVIVSTGGASPDEVSCISPFELSETLFVDTLKANLVLPYSVIVASLPLLTKSNKQNRSCLLASSVNAYGDYGYPAYSSAKAGLDGLAASLCRPLGRHGIRIGVLAFGTVVTRASRALHEEDEKHYRTLQRLTALDRFVTPEEAGVAFVTAALDLASATGFNLTIDAAQSLPGNHTEESRGDSV